MEKLGYGVRVPAFIVSPYVKRRGVSSDVFDHTSVLKTILMKYCNLTEGDENADWMSKRIFSANSVADLLTEEVDEANIATQRKELRMQLEVLGKRLQDYRDRLEDTRAKGLETPGYLEQHELSQLQQLLESIDRSSWDSR
jgi:hypothetical protein